MQSSKSHAAMVVSGNRELHENSLSPTRNFLKGVGVEREEGGRAGDDRKSNSRALSVFSPQPLALQPIRSGQHERGLGVQRKIPIRNSAYIFSKEHFRWDLFWVG